MPMLLIGGAAVLAIGAFVCGIIIIVSAFQDEVWKGIVCLLCGLYLLYYGVFEFEHEYKFPIILVWLGGGLAAAGMLRAAGVMH